MSKWSRPVETQSPSSWDFPALLQTLCCPEVFPFPFSGERSIAVIQTHASAVLLTPTLVYKLKKPEN